MREFETGSTRDSDGGKLDYFGFLSPEVLERFAQYMHAHRLQANGQLRESDNWKKGIPVREYMRSLIRHTVDLWKAYCRGGSISQDLLCAILFNTMGALFEDLKRTGKDEPSK